MHRFSKVLLPVILLVSLADTAASQTTTTIGGLTTVTSGQVSAGSVTHLNISGSGDRKIQMSELSKVVLSNLTLSPGLAFTGSSLTFAPVAGPGISVSGATITNTGLLTLAIGSGLSGAVSSGAVTLSLANSISTTTGAIVTGTITTLSATTASITTLTASSLNSTGLGVVTLSNLITGTTAAAATAASIYANTMVSGREGVRIQGVVGQTANLLSVVNAAGTSLFAYDGTNATMGGTFTTTALNCGNGGVRLDSSGVHIAFGNSMVFQDVANAAGGSPQAGLTTPTNGYVKVIGAATGTLGVIYTGGFGMGYRTISTTGSSLTTTDGIANVTTSNITFSMADSTTLTGRTTIIFNSSAGTSTVQGFTSTQFFNGSSITTLSIPSGSSLRLISTGTTTNSYYTY